MFRIKNITIHTQAVNRVNKSAAGERNDAKLMVPLEAPSEKSIKYDPRSQLSMYRGNDTNTKKNFGCCKAPCIQNECVFK